MRKFVLLPLLLLLPYHLIRAQWQTMAGGVDQVARDMVSDTANGLIYVCGYFNYAGDSIAFQIASWDGTSWNRVGNYTTPGPCQGTCGVIYSTALFNNEVFVSGSFTFQNTVFPGMAPLWHTNGTVWDTCGSANESSLLQVENGILFALGMFTEISGAPATGVATWNGNTWQMFGDTIPTGSLGIMLESIAYFQGSYFIGGNFDIGTDFQEIIAWDGSQWFSPGPGIFGDAEISKLKVYDGLLYAGGHIHQASGNPDDYLIAWDGNNWLPTFPNVQFLYQIHDLEVIDDKLYIVGEHIVWDGSAWQGPYRIGRYDGQEFCSFGGTNILIYDIAGLNGDIYVTSSKVLLGDTVNFVAKWPSSNPMDICVSQLTSSLVSLPPTISLYPNPSNSAFMLTLPANTTTCTLKIHDITGREVAASRTYRAGDPPVDVAHLSAGLYFVQVRIKDRVEVVKLVKE